MTDKATLRGYVVTDRPGRYIKQLCRHAEAMGRSGQHQFKAHGADAGLHGQVSVAATWTDSAGSIEFEPWGRCELQAVAGGFDLRIDAYTPEHLSRIADRLERNLDRAANGSISVRWASDRHVRQRRRALAPVAVGGLVVLVLAVHLGIGNLLIRHWPWPIGTLALVVAVKVALVLFVGRRSRAVG